MTPYGLGEEAKAQYLSAQMDESGNEILRKSLENDLHKLAVNEVRAEAQSAAMESITPLLTEEELAVYKRGRNAHTVRSGAEYHRATGLECLFGYLYLSDQIDRVRELFSHCVDK